ncbi:MAG TPA: coenzyme F420-0:L-glutamate ligase [Candidatus Paceibacterota bacterium]
MKVTPIKTRIFKEREDILTFIKRYFKRIPEKSILVVTSKIVSYSEDRLKSIENKKTKENLIREESDVMMRTKYIWLTIRDNMVMPSAGVDESNANGKIILLPKDSYKSAERIRRELRKYYKLKKFGVLITDSRSMPLRKGIVGVAMGYAGFKGIRDYQGTPDIFGRILNLSITDVADSLATSAVLCMGEGRERQPLALIEDAPVEFVEKTNRKELEINLKEDLYQPLFEKIKKLRW